MPVQDQSGMKSNSVKIERLTDESKEGNFLLSSSQAGLLITNVSLSLQVLKLKISSRMNVYAESKDKSSSGLFYMIEYHMIERKTEISSSG